MIPGLGLTRIQSRLGNEFRQRVHAILHFVIRQGIHQFLQVFHPSLAFLAFRRSDYPLAVAFWGRSVELEDNQAGIHSNLGQVYAQHLRDFRRALHHLNRAIQLDPGQRRDLTPWIEMAMWATDAPRKNLDR